MPKVSSTVLLAASTGFACALVAGTAGAASNPPSYGSAAAVAQIDLTVGSKTSHSVGDVSGVGAPSYRVIKAVKGPGLSLPLGGGVTPLVLTLATPAAKARASGHKEIGEQSYLAVGKTTVHSLKLELATQAVVPVRLLLIQATHLKTEASAETALAGDETTSTTASVGALTISGTLIGTPVKLSGKLKPGIVVSTPLLTISVDDVTKSTADGHKERTVAAIDVTFLGSAIAGNNLSGKIILATDSAY